MKRKVVDIKTQNNCVTIRYDNGDFFIARINLERLASLIEIEYNQGDIGASQSEILSQDGYDEYLDETEPQDETRYLPDDSYEDGQALASCGFGTDEDYGSYGDNDGY